MKGEIEETRERTTTCLWLFPLMTAAVLAGFSQVFFAGIFALAACEIVRWKPVNIIAVLHICGLLLAVFLEKGELLFLLAVVIANDGAALLAGKVFGGVLFGQAPVLQVSPNKTIEGYIGGALATLMIGIVAGKVFPAMFLAACGNAGDLLNSFVKRSYGAKDSGEGLPTGQIFTGHGGAYDRFDSVSLAIPAWLVFKMIFS